MPFDFNTAYVMHDVRSDGGTHPQVAIGVHEAEVLYGDVTRKLVFYLLTSGQALFHFFDGAVSKDEGDVLEVTSSSGLFRFEKLTLDGWRALAHEGHLVNWERLESYLHDDGDVQQYYVHEFLYPHATYMADSKRRMDGLDKAATS